MRGKKPRGWKLRDADVKRRTDGESKKDWKENGKRLREGRGKKRREGGRSKRT